MRRSLRRAYRVGVSDLHCPATVLLARHGHASYVETWFSDEGGWLSATGRAQAERLAERVRERRVAQIYASDTSRAAQTAEIVAARIGLDGPHAVVARKGLREVFVGDLLGAPFDVARLHEVTERWYAGDLEARWPGGESGTDVVGRYTEELEAIADEHRGETVLVVAHQTAASIALPALCGLPLAVGRTHQLGCGEYAAIEGDADGWRVCGA